MPVLGICRGMQLINVACGGTLVQHLPERFGHEEHRRVLGSFDGAEHDVILTEGSLAARAAGELVHMTKSHHHQGVERLGEGLIVSGVSTLDELPEAIERGGRPIVASCSACSGTPRPMSRARSSARSSTRPRRVGARALARASTARAAAVASRGARGRRRHGAIYSPPCAAVEGDQSNRLGDGGGRSRGAARAQARQRATAARRRRVAFCAPLGLCVAVRRSRGRDVAVCALQMWAYLAAYKSPHDDPEHQRARVHVDYPIDVDRVLGLGELPSVRLQRSLAGSGASAADWTALDRVLVWAHWSWFLVPHGSLAYILVRHRERFPRAARDDLRGVRPRRERLLVGPHRAALVCRRAGVASATDRRPPCGA